MFGKTWHHLAKGVQRQKKRFNLCIRFQINNLKKMLSKVQPTPIDKSSNLFLTGAILFANLDFTSIEEYAIKAAIGGMIWMVFKLAGDYIHKKVNK